MTFLQIPSRKGDCSYHFCDESVNQDMFRIVSTVSDWGKTAFKTCGKIALKQESKNVLNQYDAI